MSESLERLARNQSLFRGFNGSRRSPASSRRSICLRVQRHACASTVELKVAEYGRIRSNSTWFFVKTGRDIPEIERVVSQDDGYAVVEKLVATDFAREADPRSDGPS